MANAIVEANGGKLVDYVTTDEKHKNDSANDIMQRALETVKKREPRRFENNRPKDFREGRKPFEKNNHRPSEKVEPKKEEKAVKSTDLSTLTVAELREMAKTKDIKGYSTMKKAELLDALK